MHGPTDGMLGVQGAFEAASLAVRMWGTAARVLVAGALGSAWGEVATAAMAACSMARTTLQPFGVAAAWMHSLILPVLQVRASAWHGLRGRPSVVATCSLNTAAYSSQSPAVVIGSVTGWMSVPDHCALSATSSCKMCRF